MSTPVLPVNRETKRRQRAATAQNTRAESTRAKVAGLKERPAFVIDPDRPIFGEPGPAIRFGGAKGGTDFHLARLTTYGTKVCQTWMETHYPPRMFAGAFETVGEQIVEAALNAGDFVTLHGLLSFAIAESDVNEGFDDPKLRGRFTVRHVEDALGDQLIEAVNGLFEHAGLRWLETIVKTSAASVYAEMKNAVTRAAPEVAEMLTAALKMEAERAIKAETNSRPNSESEENEPIITASDSDNSTS